LAQRLQLKYYYKFYIQMYYLLSCIARGEGGNLFSFPTVASLSLVSFFSCLFLISFFIRFSLSF
jgi:hypothetical protein